MVVIVVSRSTRVGIILELLIVVALFDIILGRTTSTDSIYMRLVSLVQHTTTIKKDALNEAQYNSMHWPKFRYDDF